MCESLHVMVYCDMIVKPSHFCTSVPLPLVAIPYVCVGKYYVKMLLATGTYVRQ